MKKSQVVIDRVNDSQPIASFDRDDVFVLMNALTMGDEEKEHPHVHRAKMILEDVAASNGIGRPCGWYKILG